MKRVPWSGLLFGLFAVIFLAGCAKSLVYWEDARKKFNMGAEMETRARWENRFASGQQPPPEALPSLDRIYSNGEETPASDPPQRLYAEAYSKLEKALAQPSPLAKEKVLGNAYTLMALAGWQLMKYPEAEAAAAEAARHFNADPEPSPRDQPLALAVPGLVAIDKVFELTKVQIDRIKEQCLSAGTDTRETKLANYRLSRQLYEELVRGSQTDGHSLQKAFTTLDQASRLTGDNKAVAQYLLLCQLAGLKNWSDFRFQIENYINLAGIREEADIRDWLGAEKKAFNDLRIQKMKELETLTGSTTNKVYAFWDNIL